MNKIFIIVVLLLFMLCSSAFSAEVSGDVYVAGVSKYLWRGWNCFDKFALQPGADLSYGSFSLGFWGSYHVDPGDFAEADFTLSYETSISKIVGLSAGYTFYAFPQPEYCDTHEFFAGVSLDVILSPGLTLYYDVDDYEGLYAELAASYPIMILSLDASLGFNAPKEGDSSLSVLGLGLSAAIPAGPVEITPLVFVQAALDDMYKTSDGDSVDGFVSLGVTYNF